MTSILIVIDYQNDFVTGTLGHKNCLSIENNIYNAVLQHLKKTQPIIFTKDTHYNNYFNTEESKAIPVSHCIKGTFGHSIYGKLSKLAKEKECRIVEKNQFTFNNLDFLQEYKDIKEFIIVGVVTNICVLSNAILLKNNYKDIKITVLKNCCASYDNALHMSSLNIMRGLGINVI